MDLPSPPSAVFSLLPTNLNGELTSVRDQFVRQRTLLTDLFAKKCLRRSEGNALASSSFHRDPCGNLRQGKSMSFERSLFHRGWFSREIVQDKLVALWNIAPTQDRLGGHETHQHTDMDHPIKATKKKDPQLPCFWVCSMLFQTFNESGSKRKMCNIRAELQDLPQREHGSQICRIQDVTSTASEARCNTGSTRSPGWP